MWYVSLSKGQCRIMDATNALAFIRRRTGGREDRGLDTQREERGRENERERDCVTRMSITIIDNYFSPLMRNSLTVMSDETSDKLGKHDPGSGMTMTMEGKGDCLSRGSSTNAGLQIRVAAHSLDG